MKNTIMSKYLNSSGIVLFKKSEILYGLNFAKEESKKHERIIVVESYIDLISMHMASISDTVASWLQRLLKNI